MDLVFLSIQLLYVSWLEHWVHWHLEWVLKDMILVLLLFNESLISLILKSCSFALISLFFSASLFSISLSSISLILLFCLVNPCRRYIHPWLQLSYSIFNFILAIFYFFISAERDSNLFLTPASILIIVILNSGSDILLVSVLVKSLAVVSSCSFFWGEFLRFVILKGGKELMSSQNWNKKIKLQKN